MRSLNVGRKVVGAAQQGPRDARAIPPVSLQTNTGMQEVTGWKALGLRDDWGWGTVFISLVLFGGHTSDA